MAEKSTIRPPSIENLFEGDPHLKPHEPDLLLRWNKMVQLEAVLNSSEGGLDQFSQSYKHYGIVQQENGDVQVYNAASSLVGISL